MDRSPEQPLITIIIIGRNEETNLAHCIESCLAAEWANREIIYCDSESTDRSVEVVRRYPVRVIVHKNRRRNPSIGRNIGWRAAHGKYVYFIDADMVLDPHFLAAAFPVLVSREDIACVVGIRQEMHPENLYISLIDVAYHNYPRFGDVESPSGGGGLFKRDALVATGGYDEAFMVSEETLLGYALRRLGYKTILIDRRMAKHDLGVYTLGAYLQFRARQAHQLANILLLNNRTDPQAYRLAWKQVGEALAALAWFGIVIVSGANRLALLAISALVLSAYLVHKYSRYENYKRHFAAFAEILLIGKPLHIVFEVYYLVRGLFVKNHPSRAADGEILQDYPPGHQEIFRANV